MKNKKSLDEIYDFVYNVSHLEESDIVKKGLKLNEEVGELSAEILKLVKYKHTTDSSERIREHLLEEAMDTIIMVFDILVKQGYTKEEMIKMGEKKINKWLDLINNKI